MAISHTFTDDTGAGTDGTVWNNAELQSIITKIQNEIDSQVGGISSSGIEQYAATVANVANTASITTTISWTNTEAVADGDEIEIRCLVALKNDKGTDGTVTQTFGFGGATAASASGAATWADNATERIYILTYRFVRYGNDMYVAATGIANVSNVHNSFDNMNAATNTTKITTPTFTAGQTGLLRITLSAADAQFYWNTKSARIRHYT